MPREMVRSARRRRYVSRIILLLLQPLLRYSSSRDAYVLRVIGGTRGPVLRQERRGGPGDYNGPERRRSGVAFI